MAEEYGLFNDEGCVERGFWSREAAVTALAGYDPDDDLTAAKMCRDCEDDEHAEGDCDDEDEDEDEQ